MKKQLLLLLLLPLFTLAQEFSIKGTIKDQSAQAVPFVNVALLTLNDSITVVNDIATETGSFGLRAPSGSYILKVTALGFNDYHINVTVNQDIDLKTITINETALDLDNVVIDAKRPVVKRKIDRLEFNVENSALSSTNAWEILRRTPSVTASASGTLTVRGSTGILVTINDKRVYLSGDELKQLLENTNGEDIKSVEVITNPPAKYEAQGSTVINIKMKKNNYEGYKGSVGSAYVQSMYPKGVASTSHYYKSKKIALSGGYSFGAGTYFRQGKDVVHYLGDNNETTSKWVSIFNRKDKALAQNSYRFNAEYAIDSVTTLTAGTNGFVSLNSHGNYNVPTYIYNAAGQLDSLYITQNNRKTPSKTASYNAGLEHTFADKGKIILSTDYTRYYNNEYQDINSAFYLPQGSLYRATRFVSDNTQRIELFSTQLDYSIEKDGNVFETGAKFGKVHADNNLDYRDDIDGTLKTNTGRTSRFLYNENIYAGYASYSKEIDKWSLKAGLRGEYTSLEGNSVTINEINTQNYFKLFPTLYALYKPTDGHEIGFSYGKRISRPQYSWLNPFRSYYNSYSYFTGDPKLQPAIIHNISFLYTLKSKYNFDLYYRYSKNPSMEISFQDYATTTVIYKYTNIKSKVACGLDFNTSFEVYPWLTTSLQAGANYIDDTFQGIDGVTYTNNAFNYSGNINNRLVLNKDRGFGAEVNWFYSSPSVQGTFTISQVSSLSISLNKKVLKSKGEIILLVSDIYKGEKQRVTTNYANQYNYFDDYSDTQSIRLSFKYNFGNQTMKSAPVKQTTEEQDRL
jgi:hypothetical protein